MLRGDRCCAEMNEAISHSTEVTGLPESLTSIRDKEITHLSTSLPHSALSSLTLITEGLCQLLLVKKKGGKRDKEWEK